MKGANGLKKRVTKNFLLKLFKALAIISFITAAALVAVIVVMQIEKVQANYSQYLGALEELEQRVAAIDNKWLIIVVIMLLYLLRSLSPLYPLPIVWIISGMVFSPMQSFFINLLGMSMINAYRYYTGVKMGEGYWNNVIKSREELVTIFNINARYNSIVFLTLRAVPIFPYNTISHVYGSFGYPFIKFMVISDLVLAPRLISYSFLGNNVYDPLSSSFFVPLTVIMLFSGISFLLVRVVLKIIFKTNKTKDISQ